MCRWFFSLVFSVGLDRTSWVWPGRKRPAAVLLGVMLGRGRYDIRDVGCRCQGGSGAALLRARQRPPPDHNSCRRRRRRRLYHRHGWRLDLHLRRRLRHRRQVPGTRMLRFRPLRCALSRQLSVGQRTSVDYFSRKLLGDRSFFQCSSSAQFVDTVYSARPASCSPFSRTTIVTRNFEK